MSEEKIADIDRQMDDVRANIDTNGARRESVDRLKDTISEMWNHIDELPDDKVKAFMKSFIAEIHVTEEPDVIQGNNYWVKRISFKVPIRVSETEEGDTFNVDHSFQPNVEHVEEYDLSGKRIIPFCSHGGGRFGQSLTAIAKLAPDADMGEGLSVHYSGGSTLTEDIQAWLDVNGIAR